jgi:hypothetical protein
MSCFLLQIFLVVCIIGVCSAVAVTKTKDVAKTKTDVKDNKEKRESSVSSGPYSYDPPQKSFTIPLHETLKTQTTYEYKPAKVQYEYVQKPAKVQYEFVQKPAQIDVVQIPKKVSTSIPVEYYHQEAKQVAAPQVQYSYPAALESYLQTLSLKDYHQESPVVYYQPSQSSEHSISQQQNSYYYKFPTTSSSSSNYKAPASSSYSYYQPLHTSHVPSYHYISESKPQQQQQQQHQQEEVYHGYSEISSNHQQQQQPQLFFPASFTSELSHKHVKSPAYAIGHKGLGHYASVAALSPEFATYIKPQTTHEYQYFTTSTQTERPFRPSVHLTTPIRGYDSYSEQTISNAKPNVEYLPPKKTYLPAKEEVAQPIKTYLPVNEQTVEFVTQPSKKYLPSKQEYINPHPQQHQPQVEYQIQYITVPEKSYLPPTPQNTYIPPKKVQEPPKNTYIPPIVVSSTTSKPIVHSTQSPKNTYLPPNNPYQSSYQVEHMNPSIYEQFNQDEQYGDNDYHQYQQQQQQQRYSSSSHK